jgi:hypothetical protein
MSERRRETGELRDAGGCESARATSRSLPNAARVGFTNPTNGSINFSYWFQSMVNDSVNAMCPVVQEDLILISAAYYRIGACCCG